MLVALVLVLIDPWNGGPVKKRKGKNIYKHMYNKRTCVYGQTDVDIHMAAIEK